MAIATPVIVGMLAQTITIAKVYRQIVMGALNVSIVIGIVLFTTIVAKWFGIMY